MLAKRVLKVWTNYLTSQFLVTLFVFAATWLAGWLTGLKFPFVNALAAGVCEVIPNFGPIISTVISAILALAFGSSKLSLANWQFALLIAAICIVIQMLQNWLISPLLIGKTMDLNPILVFAGMLVFSALFGFWGMILAVPIMGTLKEVRKYTDEKKEQQPEDRLELNGKTEPKPNDRLEPKGKTERKPEDRLESYQDSRPSEK